MEEAKLADVLDKLRVRGKRPDAVTLDDIIEQASGSFRQWLMDRRNARTVSHRLESCGYIRVRKPSTGDGMWRVHGERKAVYARSELIAQERLAAAMKREKA